MNRVKDWGVRLLGDHQAEAVVDQAEQDRLARTIAQSHIPPQGRWRRLLLPRAAAALIAWLLYIKSGGH